MSEKQSAFKNRFSKLKRFKPGDQVFASTFENNFGAHAEYKCLPEDGVIVTKPNNMTYEEAATLSLGANTALFFLIGGTARPCTEALVFLKERVETGRLKSVIDRCYPLEHIVEFYRYVETGHKQGNVVITMEQKNVQ